jgi:murein DD-endopeptidase MepM/ murein hydrolase activator NlpD
MSSKAEKTSHNLQQHRSSIFFRNPALLKIVAWLGCLGFIGSTGIVWADLKPISASKAEVPQLVAASASAPTNTIESPAVELFGPPIPLAWRQSPSQVTADKLPNREVPIAISPAAAATQPIGKPVRPQHTDVLVADNYTVGVNGSVKAQTPAEEFVTIPVPAPRQSTIPTSHSGEMVRSSQSQLQPRYDRKQSPVSKSIPTTSIAPKAESGQSSTPYRAVPKVPSLSATGLNSNPRRTGMSIPTPVAATNSSQRPLASLKPVVVTPMKPAVTARATTATQVVPDRTLGASLSGQSEISVVIPVPAPRTQIIRVQAVAQLPQVTTMRSIPTIPPIPTVRPAAANFQSKPIAYVNNGEHDSTSELIYPLTSPAPTTSGFGWRTHPITGSRRFHSGIDIGAPMGAPVVAAGSGTVITAGRLGGYGNAVVIQHNGVQQTLYGHLSEVFVLPGQTIEQGTVVGRVGSTGNSTGPHLHFESRMSTVDGWVAVDPSDDVKYALDNLRRAMPFAQRDLPPGVN